MTPPRVLTVAIAFALAVTACSGSARASLTVDVDRASVTPTAVATAGPTPEPASANETDGIWLVDGYGYVLETLDGQVAATYLPIDDRCMPAEFSLLESFDLSDENTGRIEIENSVNWYLVERIELPAACASFAFDAAPTEIVDSFIALMGERYPFFVERGVDWPAAQVALRAAAVEAPDSAAAADVIADFLWQVGDSHNGIDAELAPPAELIEEYQSLESELDEAMAEVTERLGDSLNTDATGVVTWGRLNPTTGYINIERLAGFDGFTDDAAQDQALLATALDDALGELQDTERLVLDLRTNGGGSDSVSLEAISRFIDAPLDLFTKESYSAPDATRQLISVEPTDRVSYDGDVTVLVSPATASAAEILGAGMSRAGATIVGPRSEGVFSDVIPWLLPGGIEMGMSMEVYRDLDGVSYEVRGVPIDVEASIAESLDSALAN